MKRKTKVSSDQSITKDSIVEIPLQYNKRSTKKPIFLSIYYNYFCELVNNKTYNPRENVVSKMHLFKAMKKWANDGQYLQYFDNKNGLSQLHIQSELTLFHQYFTPQTLGYAIRVFLFSNGKPKSVVETSTQTIKTEFSTTTITTTTTTLANKNQSIFVALKPKDGAAYKIDYEKLKAFLIDNGHYNENYEKEEVKETLVHFLFHSYRPLQSNCRYDIYMEFLKSLIAEAKEKSIFIISGADLFKAMKTYVKENTTTAANPEWAIFNAFSTDLTITKFGMDITWILIKTNLAEKRYTNTGTLYYLPVDKLRKEWASKTNTRETVCPLQTPSTI